MAYWQLIQLGLSPDAIHHRVKTGRLHRLHRGVYAVGHAAVTAEGRDMAAVLACGPGALLSHWSAAAQWRLLRPHRGPVWVIAPKRCIHAGIQAQTVRQLHPHDRTRRHAIPITSVPRTLLDLASVASHKQLTRAVNEAERAGRVNRHAIEQLLERNPRRKGTKALRAVIAAVSPETRRSRSDLEVAFLELCRRHDLPLPRVNTTVEGAYLETRGYTVVRITDRWLASDPRDVAATVRALLAAGG